MKILFSAPNIFVDGKAGDATHVRELATHLSRLNNEVEVLARQKDNFNNLYEFKLLRLNLNLSLETLPILLFFEFYTFLKAFFLVLKNHYDCIYERHHVFDVACFIGKIFSIPTIVEINALLIDESKIQGKYGIIAYLIAKRYEKFIFLIADRLIIGAPELMQVLIAEYGISPNKIEVIPNGANINLFKPIKNAREKLHLDKNNKYVCFVGSIIGWQGLENLIKCGPKVIKKMDDVKFLIVGGGREERIVREKIKESGYGNHFICVGAVPYNNVPLYINASDVCITLKKELKSGYSPTKLYEYMACGKPIVASNYSGHKILSEYNAGILVNAEDISEVSDAIIKLLKDDGLRRRMGENGRRIVIEKFSWERVARDVAKVCEGVVRGEK